MTQVCAGIPSGPILLPSHCGKTGPLSVITNHIPRDRCLDLHHVQHPRIGEITEITYSSWGALRPLTGGSAVPRLPAYAATSRTVSGALGGAMYRCSAQRSPDLIVTKALPPLRQRVRAGYFVLVQLVSGRGFSTERRRQAQQFAPLSSCREPASVACSPCRSHGSVATMRLSVALRMPELAYFKTVALLAPSLWAAIMAAC